MPQPTLDSLIQTYFDTDDRFGEFGRKYLETVRHARRDDKDDLRLFVSFAMSLARKAHGQVFQDIWAFWESDRKRGGYFVEFGAASGSSLSNTYLLEKRFDWNGIVAEPNPIFVPMVKAARSCYISDKCVYSRSGEKILFQPAMMGELSRIVDIVPQDSLEHAGARQIGNVPQVEVETISLNDLLIEGGAPPIIDFLSVDTEGSEFEILSHFDFGRWRINAICVEHNYTPMRESLYDLLTANGYRRKWESFSHFDDWYVLDK